MTTILIILAGVLGVWLIPPIVLFVYLMIFYPADDDLGASLAPIELIMFLLWPFELIAWGPKVLWSWLRQFLGGGE